MTQLLIIMKFFCVTIFDFYVDVLLGFFSILSERRLP